MFDPLTDAAAAFSSRRSASRARLIITLAERGGLLSAPELAHECGWDLWRLRAVAVGRPPGFSIDRSPLALGQIALHETPHGQFVVLLQAGHDEARRLLLEPFWARGRGRVADLR